MEWASLRLFARNFFALLLCVWLAPALAAQDDGRPAHPPSSNAEQRDTALSPERIVERPVEPRAATRIVRIPLAPLILFDRGLEKGLLWTEENRVTQRLTLRQGWLNRHHLFLQFGSLGAGSDTAFGIAYQHNDIARRGIRLSVPVMVSVNAYQQYESLLSVPVVAGRWLRLEFGPQFRSRPEEPFTGIGSDSRRGDRTSYFLQDRSGGARLAAEWGRPSRGARVDFGFRYTNTDVFRGRNDDVPSTEQVFPGLAGFEGASLLRYGFSASLRAIDNIDDPRRGFRTRGRLLWVDSLRADGFNHFEYGMETAGYLPLGGPRTLAMRLIGEFREPGRNGRVPFFALATLGGGGSLRGYKTRRFHDLSMLAVTGEYRYKIHRAADFALFADHGQVAREPGDFSLGNFRGSYGAGVRVRSRTGVLIRFDVARSNEGVRLHITFAPEF
jgi:outer membrane protein assembly factor BamA